MTTFAVICDFVTYKHLLLISQEIVNAKTLFECMKLYL